MTAQPLAQSPDSATTGRPLAGVAGIGSVAVLLVAGLAGVPLRVLDSGLLVSAGPVALVVAVIVGMPHGALDTELLGTGPETGGGRLRRGASAAAYVSAAGVVFLGWTHWPAAGVGVLLVVSAGHFAWTDHVTSRWRAPAAVRAATVGRAVATGALAVSTPFAWWPDQTGPLLGRLGVGPAQWQLFADGARGLFTVAAVGGIVAVVAAVAHRDLVAALEPLAVVAVTLALPPLLGFAVYFAGWHAWRQTVRLIALHPDARRCLRRGNRREAAAVLVRRACFPTVMALGVVGLVVLSTGDASAAVLVSLLAVSVPHAVVAVVTDWRPPPDVETPS